MEKTKDDSKEIIQIKLKKRHHINLYTECLTKDEIKRLIKVAKNIQEKAIISTLFETGCRSSEFLNLEVGDVKFSNPCTIIKINGRNGSRVIPVMKSVRYLKRWIGNHPSKNTNSPLWVNKNNKPLTYASLDRLLKKLGKKAKIEKRIHAHLFRTSRIVNLCKNGSNETMLRKFHGLKQLRCTCFNSEILKKYCKV
jgi:site-specific recombinase XerD